MLLTTFMILKKLKKADGLLNSKVINNFQKHTYVNLNTNIASIQMSDCTEPLLAYFRIFIS